MDILIGADPEFFVKKDGKHVSAYGLIAGNKKDPLPVKDGAIQVDGMALEFNINPAKNKKEFRSNIRSVLAQFREIIPAEYEFDFVPVAHFGKDYIEGQPLEARRLGCEPDFNAWAGGVANPAPDASAGFRTASGHIHIGWTKDEDVTNPDHLEACNMLVKQLDAYLGLYSIVLDPDNTRRQLYGKAGAYRPKSYGVEYRVMSNFWLKEDWMIEDVFTLASAAFSHLLQGERYYGTYAKDCAFLINKGTDFENAYRILCDYAALSYNFQDRYNIRHRAEVKKQREEEAAKIEGAKKFRDLDPLEYNAKRRKRKIADIKLDEAAVAQINDIEILLRDLDL